MKVLLLDENSAFEFAWKYFLFWKNHIFNQIKLLCHASNIEIVLRKCKMVSAIFRMISSIISEKHDSQLKLLIAGSSSLQTRTFQFKSDFKCGANWNQRTLPSAYAQWWCILRPSHFHWNPKDQMKSFIFDAFPRWINVGVLVFSSSYLVINSKRMRFSWEITLS